MDSVVSNINSFVKKHLRKERQCIVCEEKTALFCVKGIPKDCYCKDCAEEQFGELEMLEKL